MLATEADVFRTLETGTYTLGTLYAECLKHIDVARDGGLDPVPGHAGDLRWKHRARGALQTLRRSGRAERVTSGWLIQGPPQQPSRLLLVVAGGTPREFELRLAEAVKLLSELDEPADLVLADPPWGLGRGTGRHYADGNGYRRDCSKIVPGYVDVDPGRYPAFTREWVSAAAAALRPGGQLAVITGPQRTGIVQVAAEEAGLTFVSKIAAQRPFPLRTLSRPAFAHWDINVMCRGALTHPRRFFDPPPDLPPARSGALYPLDWWPDNGRADRPGLYRRDNALPLKMVLRTVRMLSAGGEHVVVPFLGSGTEAVAAWIAGRRLTAGDINPHALRFAAARMLEEHIWPDEKTPGLFPRPA